MKIRNVLLAAILIMTIGLCVMIACHSDDDDEDENDCDSDDDDNNDDSKKVNECCFILCTSGAKTTIGYFEMDQDDCETEAENFCSDKDPVEMFEFDPDCGELCGCDPPEWYV